MATEQSTTFAAKHYPLEILGRQVHILNSCATYASILQELVTSSTINDLAILAEFSSLKKSSTAAATGTTTTNYFDLFAPSITTTSQHIPHGQMKRIQMFKYLSPNGVKAISGETVNKILKDAKMPFVTDLISKACVVSTTTTTASPTSTTSSSSPALPVPASKQQRKSKEEEDAINDQEVAMFEQLKEMTYTELDVARCCLCVLWELTERGIFDKNSGELTPLAKRDMKRALTSASKGNNTDDQSTSSNAAAASSSPAAAASSSGSKALVATNDGLKAQKNLRALLEEEVAAAFPYVPIDKAVVFTITNDPEAPRHKPRFKAVVEFPNLKKLKVEGDWAPTKRDAENSAADKSLPTVRRLLKK